MSSSISKVKVSSHLHGAIGKMALAGLKNMPAKKDILDG